MRTQISLVVGLLLTYGLYAQDGDTVDGASFDESAEATGELFNYPAVNPREVWKKNGYDSERVEIKRFDVEKWKKVVGKTDYRQGHGDLKKEDASSDKSDPFGGNISMNLPIPALLLKIIFYMLAFGTIGYLLFMVIRDTSLKAKPKALKKESDDPIDQVADIRELEVDSLLAGALSSSNYPLAIRIYFLGLLKKLDADGFIIWKKDKTNRDYLTELFHKQHYFDEVKRLTLAYEEVWYGGHDFPVPVYEKIISSFKAIDLKLNGAKTREE